MKKSTSFLIFIIILIVPITFIFIFVFIIDPFFHFHKPLPGLSYSLYDDRYQNDGILKHFDYDVILSGSSETQNIRTSEIDTLFGVHSVKASYAGGSFYEINNLINTGIEYNANIKAVIRSFDPSMLIQDKDDYFDGNPDYLYDRNPFNDYKYVFNKEVIIRASYSLFQTLRGTPPTSFDEYTSFYNLYSFGKESVLSSYERVPLSDDVYPLSDADRITIYDNINQNIVSLALAHPEIDFYYFIPPYSVCVWDAAKRLGQLDQCIDSIIYAYELVMDCPNIKVFSFDDLTDIATNLDLYMDTLHYNEDVCSFILKSMSENNYLLTKDNYLKRYEYVRNFYSNYDYDSIFSE